MVNITKVQSNDTPSSAMGAPSYNAGKVLTYSGNFGATEGETLIDKIPVSAFRQFLLSVISTAWGVATVTIKVYPCDSGGNATGNAFFAIAVSSATTQIVMAAEMGGTTSGATYPGTAQTSGVVIGPLGSYLRLTETCTFTSGTNTVALEFNLKG